MAIQAHNLLANGMGGIDWAGLPYACAWLGIDDVDGLMTRLLVIKTHRTDLRRTPDGTGKTEH